MKPIKKLVVHGYRDSKMDVKEKFNQPNYLELHYCTLLSPDILSSTRLEHLFLNGVNMQKLKLIKTKYEEILNKARADDSLDLEQFESKRLKCLSIIIDRL